MGSNPEILSELPPHILLMEDEENVGRGLQMVLTEAGYRVDWATSGMGALEKIRQKPFDLLMADLWLPDIDGMDVIKQVKQQRPETIVIVITGYGGISSAVDAMKLGAFEYLPKPFAEDEIIAAVGEAFRAKEAQRIKKSSTFDSEEGKLIEKREVIRVLDRASRDERFWRALLEVGSDALDGYGLTLEAKAAIVSGDLSWIRKNIGELNERRLGWIRSRLEMEKW
jgi:DNA-binding response OmpR family regulator